MIDTSDTGISCQQKYQISFSPWQGNMSLSLSHQDPQIGFSSLHKEPEEVESFVKKLKVESSALIDICVNQNNSTIQQPETDLNPFAPIPFRDVRWICCDIVSRKTQCPCVLQVCLEDPAPT